MDYFTAAIPALSLPSVEEEEIKSISSSNSIITTTSSTTISTLSQTKASSGNLTPGSAKLTVLKQDSTPIPEAKSSKY